MNTSEILLHAFRGFTSKPVSSLHVTAPHVCLKASMNLSTFDHVVCGFSLLVFLPYLMPMAITAPDIEPHVSPFKENPAPVPVAIFGISSDLMPKYSMSVRRTLSQQLYGRPSGKLGWLSWKYLAAFSCSSSTGGKCSPRANSLLVTSYNV